MLLCMARIIFLWMFSVLWCRLSSPCAAQPALWCSFPTLTPLVTRCPSAPLLQQPWLCGLWPRQWHKAPHLEGSCTWVNTLLSSSWNSSSFMNKRPADDVVNPVPQEGLARFYSKKKKKPPSWVLCAILSLVSQKPFPLFDSQLSPWVSSWVYARCFTESLMFISCPLTVFSQQPNRRFTTWP